MNKKDLMDKQDDSSDSETSASDDESDHDHTVSNDDQDDGEEIDVDFDAVCPVESDFHGIKQLLLRVFLNLAIDVSELTDLVIAQSKVGSVVKVVDDEEDGVYGVLSALSMEQHKEKSCMKELVDVLSSKCKKCAKEQHNKFVSIMKEKNVGLVMNERFINIPPHISVPLHNSLRDDVSTNIKENSSLDFDYLLLFTKTTLDEPQDSSDDEAPKAKKAKKDVKEVDDDELVFANYEEEFFHKHAEVSFSFDVTQATGSSVGGNWDLDDQPMKSYRTIMLVPTSKWKDVLSELAESMSGELTYEEGM